MKLALATAWLLPACTEGLLVSSASMQERSLLANTSANTTANTPSSPTHPALREGCGPAPEYAHAQPQSYADARKTFFNATSKQTEEVRFAVGKNITFECRRGYTVNGSKDGATTFNAECTSHGYYNAHGVCLKASKCGPVPTIAHAVPTGEVVGNKVEYACAQGYSIDGEKVVEGGFGKNRFFELECIEFSGEYAPFEGNCTPYAFVPATETVRIYNQVTEALFIVSCKGSLMKAFGKGETPGLGSVCSNFQASSAACAGLVAGIKSDFAAKLAEKETWEEDKDWYEDNSDRPGIGEEAHTFCAELWELLKLPSL